MHSRMAQRDSFRVPGAKVKPKKPKTRDKPQIPQMIAAKEFGVDRAIIQESRIKHPRTQEEPTISSRVPHRNILGFLSA